MIKYMDPSGSQWRKWDLHVHTPASALNHSLGSSWDIYVEKLIDAINTHNIAAIATADYFSIEGYRLLQKYYNTTTRILTVNDKSATVFLIPGIELRLNIFNSDDESINIHILFDPGCCSPDFIDQHFLEELKVNYRGTEYSLKNQALLAIGKSIANTTTLSVGEDFSVISETDKKAYLKKALGAVTLVKRDINDALKDIDEIFATQKLPPKAYLVCVVGKGYGGICALKWFEENKSSQFSRAGLIREDLTHHADVIFSNNKNDREFYLGQSSGTNEEEVKTRFNKLKPCVWGSDSHDLTRLLHPSNGTTKDYTWIKSEVTFEGLKQTIYEPELRVKVQEDNPSESETFAKIDKLDINFPTSVKILDKESKEETDFCLKDSYSISFSNNLTCIVGGRGSGKSTLIHILYNSWAYKESSKLIELNSPLNSLQLTKDPLNKVKELVNVSIPPNTEFFLQNEIEKFAKDVTKMSSLVRNRIERLSLKVDGQEELTDENSAEGPENKKSLKELEDDWTLKTKNMTELINAYDKISEYDKKIKLVNENIKTLKSQTDVIKSEDYKTIQKEINNFSTEISNFENYTKEYNEAISELSHILKSIKKYNWEKYGGQETLDEIVAKLEEYKIKLDEEYQTAKTKFETNSYNTKLNSKKTELRKYLSEKGLSPENIGELADATEQITAYNNEIEFYKKKKEPLDELYTLKDSILTDYKTTYQEYHTRFFELSSSLQRSLGGLKFDDHQTEITFHPHTDNKLLKKVTVDFIKEKNDSKITLNSDNIESVIFDNEIPISEFISNKMKMVEVVESSQKAVAHTQIIRELFNDSVFLEQLHLRMFNQYFNLHNIQVQTKLGEKSLQNTSFGERCGIVIAIILVAGTNPIIIDQPEDNLDGKFISNVLVPLLRKQKQNRQIILVTRDANLVIGSDSELIEILERGVTRTEFLPATIENKIARPKYIWIIDGGEVAFQKREEKYNLV